MLLRIKKKFFFNNVKLDEFFHKKKEIVAPPINIIRSSWNFQELSFSPSGIWTYLVLIEIQKFENWWLPNIQYMGVL